MFSVKPDLSATRNERGGSSHTYRHKKSSGKSTTRDYFLHREWAKAKVGRVAGDEAKAAGPTRRALYSYPFERRTSYLLTFLTPSFHRLPRRCRIDDGHVPLASQPALSTVREFLIRSLAFFLPVSFFLPPSSPPRCTRNHAFNLD